MAEDRESKPDANARGAEREFGLQRVYLKDVSFEIPNSPAIFGKTWKPEVTLNLTSKVNPLEKAAFEVVLSITVTVKIEEMTAYLAEVQQAGIFTLKGFSDQEIGPMLGSYCPNQLFPYAREVISDLVLKGGFPQMLLAPVNFDALYAQHLQQQEKAAQQSSQTH